MTTVFGLKEKQNLLEEELSGKWVSLTLSANGGVSVGRISFPDENYICLSPIKLSIFNPFRGIEEHLIETGPTYVPTHNITSYTLIDGGEKKVRDWCERMNEYNERRNQEQSKDNPANQHS